MPSPISRRQALPLIASSTLWLNRALNAQFPPPATPPPSIPLDTVPEKFSSREYSQATGYLRRLIANGQFPGAILMIHRRGEPEFVYSAGWLDADHRIPMLRDGIFFLASLSKPVTGVATLALIEQGKLKLDDPVEKWLPELAHRQILNDPAGPLDQTYPSPRPVNVQDLLSFRCGYGGDGPRGPFGAALRQANTSPRRAVTLPPAQFLDELHPIPLQFAPGQHWLYDVPADLLGVLIARVTGNRYSDFLGQYVLDPLGMKDTGFWVPPPKVSRIAHYPAGSHDDTPPLVDPLFESGAHGMVSTADDYMRFTQMLLNKGELGGIRILKPGSVDSMRIDRLSPQEHKAGGFIERYPGRGFGYCGAVWLDPPQYGPSVGSYNWAGASGVWMMVDYVREMTIVIMVQHPGGGPPAGADQPAGTTPPSLASYNLELTKKYLPQTVWNDLIQTEIYKGVV